MRRLWLFLHRKRNREVLAWLGGGLAAVAGAAWVVFVYLDKPSSTSTNTGPDVQATGGSVAAGGNIEGSTITIEQPGGAHPSEPTAGNGDDALER